MSAYFCKTMKYYPKRQDTFGGNTDFIRESSFGVAIIESAADCDGPPNKVLTLVLLRNRLHTAAFFTSYGVQKICNLKHSMLQEETALFSRHIVADEFSVAF
jgi:hypothetical protein